MDNPRPINNGSSGAVLLAVHAGRAGRGPPYREPISGRLDAANLLPANSNGDPRAVNADAAPSVATIPIRRSVVGGDGPSDVDVSVSVADRTVSITVANVMTRSDASVMRVSIVGRGMADHGMMTAMHAMHAMPTSVGLCGNRQQRDHGNCSH